MHKPQKRKKKLGTMVVEAALILPLLLILTFGGLKYGWLFLKWQQTTNVARHAVRYAIRWPVSAGDAELLIDELMDDIGLGATGYTRSVTYGSDDYPTGSIVGDSVIVNISVPAASVDILKISLLPSPETISATLTMSKEGP